MADSSQIIRLHETRFDEATRLLARAFHDDPLHRHACPDPVERARWLPLYFVWFVWRGYLFGETLGTAGELAGVAASIQPGGGRFVDEQRAKTCYERGSEIIGVEAWDRYNAAFDRVFDPVEDALHRAVPEPHWYLDLLGVDPAFQGKGIGSSLIRTVNARADADALPVVLLTFQANNCSLYRRLGYEIVCEGTERSSGLRWWGFRRNPGM